MITPPLCRNPVLPCLAVSPTAAWRRVLVAALLLCAAGASRAATFVVTDAADPGDGACTQASCTLREAITAANLTTAADTINFAILTPIRGEILIRPVLPLPTILHPVVIDGYAQGGAAENTDPTISNALLRIRLDGANPGAINFGLSVCSSNVTVRGLSITGFPTSGLAFGSDQDGASCGSSFSGGVVSGNFLGLGSNGATSDGNGRGISVRNGVVRIGGSGAAHRNVISANLVNGINLENAATSTSVVENNLIGTDKSGTLIRGNLFSGINFANGVASVRVGGATTTNLIANNATGVTLISAAGAGNTLFNNRFVANANLGIDLRGDGVTINDADDADTGPNTVRNFPVITTAARVAGGLAIQGSEDIGGSAPSNFTLAFYAGADCDASGHGEGERLLGTAPRTLQNGVTESFNITLTTSDPLPPGTVITATATDPAGNTSEFSACFFLDPPPLVVNSTADPGTSGCNATECTLREAIATVNARAVDSLNQIEFDILSPATGELMIQPASPLPTINRTVLIDGYSQPGTSLNTDANASNAVLRVRIDGASAGATASGLSVCADNVVIRGLSITGYSAAAINFGVQNTGSLCTNAPEGGHVGGNFLGLMSDGSTSFGNGRGVAVTSRNPVIGGTDLADRNVISANTAGIQLGGSAASGGQVLNNLIGTDRTGVLDHGNATGIFLNGAPANSGAGNNLIGSAVAPNRIAFNGHGIHATSLAGDGNTWLANTIHSSDNLGIDLGTNGVTANDIDDADIGTNGLQNFPELTLAQRSATGLRIAGSLDLPAGPGFSVYTIGVYANATCDPSGHGEGERFLGSQGVTLTHIAGEAFSFELATNDLLGPGTQITATATAPDGSSSEFSECVAATDPPPGFIVTSTTDTDDGACNPAHCSLREAINAANTQAGADQISFNISPGTGPFTISPATELPTITEAVIVDGYTQLGSGGNTADTGSNATIQIVLDSSSTVGGLGVCADDVTIRGMAFVGAPDASIAFGTTPIGAICGPPITGAHIQGNFFGLLPDGVSGSNAAPVRLRDARGEIGGIHSQDRNVFARGLGAIGVTGSASSGSIIRGNYFGTDASGSGDLGQSSRSVVIGNGASGVTVGDPAAPNVFRFSAVAIEVTLSSTGNRLYANEFADHDLIAINLCPGTGGCPQVADGNDPDDDDPGGNNRQNFPVLSSAIADADSLSVQGTLDVPAATSNAPYTIALYENVACHPSGNGEGEIFLGAQIVNLSGNAQNFSVSLDFPDPAIPPAAVGRFITSTATAPDGSTSEFSACVAVSAAPPTSEIFKNGFE